MVKLNESEAKKLEAKYKNLLVRNEINTPQRKAMFFAVLDYKSKFTPTSENLNHSKAELLSVFSKYFNDAAASSYARKPEEIANHVYANRMGNGAKESGDGWKYRGRGYIQLKGKDNYQRLSNDTKIDFVNSPDLLLEEVYAMIGVLWFWKTNNLNSRVDKKQNLVIAKIINENIKGIELDKIMMMFNAYLLVFA